MHIKTSNERHKWRNKENKKVHPWFGWCDVREALCAHLKRCVGGRENNSTQPSFCRFTHDVLTYGSSYAGTFRFIVVNASLGLKLSEGLLAFAR